MHRLLNLFAVSTVTTFASLAHGAVILDFASQGDEVTQFQVVGSDAELGSVTATLTSTYVENSTLKAFDSNTSGIGLKGSIQGDNFGAGESFTISFNKAVKLTSMTFNAFQETTPLEKISYASGSISGSFQADGDNSNPTLQFAGQPQLAADTPLAFTVIDGRFRIRSMTVSAVPEPTSLALVGLTGVLGLRRRR